ncbi:hypothetical protein [Microbacterium sp. H6]|uniref:hypothetical protein n=1 Tax=Microbacterium sp. H6 TaxID=421122 RepID=UPI000DE38BE9|nr:hypothetical protein [Microbacterium sp. H6]RBO72826.1 hypothetical protein DSP71_08860 [Microbacterium sp. H6]
MTEQTGNNKPNDAEGLAFPLSGNEKLIEEAARKWIDNLLGGNGFGSGYTSDELDTWATELVAVFEKALTPTDDEREALDYLDEMNEAGRIEYDDYRNLHDFISGAVEPAREMFPGTLAALDDLTTLPKKGQER